jgi:hypothetical protein
MCHFVTAILPSTAPQSELDAVARKYGRQLRPLASPSMERQLRPDQRYFFTTVGHCDCGTVLGSYHQRALQAPDWAVEEQRLLKRGWSKAKVARALAQKRERSASSDEVAEEASTEELASWTRLIAEILQSGTRELGLLLHSYRGPLDEEIQLKGTEQIAIGDAAGDMLRKMREDVLYVFRGGA